MPDRRPTPPLKGAPVPARFWDARQMRRVEGLLWGMAGSQLLLLVMAVIMWAKTCG